MKKAINSDPIIKNIIDINFVIFVEKFFLKFKVI